MEWKRIKVDNERQTEILESKGWKREEGEGKRKAEVEREKDKHAEKRRRDDRKDQMQGEGKIRAAEK